MNILIVYGTTEGQTRKIAQRMAQWVQERGHQGTTLEAEAMTGVSIRGYDAYILAGSIHYGKHQRALVQFVKQNLVTLSEKPAAFVSVSASASRTDDRSQDAARHCIAQFAEETGWVPTAIKPIGGAIAYTKYGFFKRLMLKRICAQEGGPTDTSRDHELTDWSALRTFVEEFVAGAERGNVVEQHRVLERAV